MGRVTMVLIRLAVNHLRRRINDDEWGSKLVNLKVVGPLNGGGTISRQTIDAGEFRRK